MDYTLLLAELVTAIKDITSASANMTGAEILEAMLGVDGAGSGLDADTLDGKQASDFALAGSVPGEETAASILTKLKTVDGAGSGLDADTLDGIQGTDYLPRGEAYQNFYSDPASVLTDLKTVDGAGSGLDADKLDGKQASAFALAGSGIELFNARKYITGWQCKSSASAGSYTIDISQYISATAKSAIIMIYVDFGIEGAYAIIRQSQAAQDDDNIAGVARQYNDSVGTDGYGFVNTEASKSFVVELSAVANTICLSILGQST